MNKPGNNGAAPDITVLLNVHRESSYLARTLRSLDEAMAYAGLKGLTCELLVVLDSPDDDTRNIVRRLAPLISCVSARCIEIEERSLARARNAGVAAARGAYVSLHDADDLCSFNYLAEHHKLARSRPGYIILPGHYYCFGAKNYITRYEEARAIDLFDHHPYLSHIFVEREILVRNAYVHPRAELNRAFEDWHMNGRLLVEGCRFTPCDSTVLFYRQRLGSIMAATRATELEYVTEWSPYYAPVNFFNLFCQQKSLISAPVDFWRLRAVQVAVDAAAAIEPIIDPRNCAQGVYRPASRQSFAGELYANICKKLLEMFGGQATSLSDIFVLPDLSAGGGEKYLIQVAKQLASLSGRKILFLTTDVGARNNWSNRLQGIAQLLDVGQLVGELGVGDGVAQAISKCVLRLAESQETPVRIHIKPSDVGHTTLDYLAPLIEKNCLVYYRWCDNIRSGFDYSLVDGYNLRVIDAHHGRLMAVLCDCESVKKYDEGYLGKELQNWHVVRGAIEGAENHLERQSSFRRRLIWAGRLDPQKRVDILPLIFAKLALRLPDVSVDVYGVARGSAWKRRFSGMGNVCAKDPFSNPTEVISPRNYDAMIYTSVFDGVPNVIIETLSAGVPVIAPDIGGIAEAFPDEHRSFLIDHIESDEMMAEKYVDAISNVYSRGIRSQAEAAEALRQYAMKKFSYRAQQSSIIDIFKV